ncbi:MAG: FixH family protein [Deltaproteobacteria bacterium]
MRLAFVAISMFAAACGGGGDTGADAAIDCSTVGGVDTFTVGLEKAGVGGMVDFKLMSIDPAPVVRGNNTWIVQVDSMSSGVVGSPMDGATLSAVPFMPAHQHGSPITATVMPTGNPGEYTMGPINLWMPGVWETTISVKSPTADRAVYSFCVN